MNEKIKCDICGSEFKNEEALGFHKNAKHPVKKVEPKKSKKGLFIGISIIALISILAIFLLSGSASSGEYDSFAQCITDSGAKMYGAYWCPHCISQKKLFGKSWENIDYIECSLPNRGGQNQICNDAGIEGYPTWEFADKSRVSGAITLERLAQLTSCELVKDVE